MTRRRPCAALLLTFAVTRTLKMFVVAARIHSYPEHRFGLSHVLRLHMYFDVVYSYFYISLGKSFGLSKTADVRRGRGRIRCCPLFVLQATSHVHVIASHRNGHAYSMPPRPNIRVLRDIKARQGVADNEISRRAYLYVARNQSLPPQVRYQAQLQLNTFGRYTRPTTVKNRCTATGRGRGVIGEFGLCRVRNGADFHPARAGSFVC